MQEMVVVDAAEVSMELAALEATKDKDGKGAAKRQEEDKVAAAPSADGRPQPAPPKRADAAFDFYQLLASSARPHVDALRILVQSNYKALDALLAEYKGHANLYLENEALDVEVIASDGLGWPRMASDGFGGPRRRAQRPPPS